MKTTEKKTPLYESHQKLNGRMIDFGGWLMPVQYEGIIIEHEQTRDDVSIFDICHMGEFLIEGPDALKNLSNIISADLKTLPDGKCRYGFLLNDKGGIIDDLISYRKDLNHWMVVVNAGTLERDFDWIKSHLKGDVKLTDISTETAKLDIQGPNSIAITEKVLNIDLNDLKYFSFKNGSYDGEEILISRTGYTGEIGVELYLNAKHAVNLWDAFIASGVKPAGLGARDTLRLEAGLPLYGHELTEDTTPVEANLSRFAKKEELFIGSETVKTQLISGAEKKLVPFMISGRRTARNNNPVLVDGEIVGSVTSGSYSPSLGYSIGFAYLPIQHANTGEKIYIQVGKKLLEGEIVSLPFYKRN